MSSLPQPLVAYPRPISTQPSSDSKGSFGPVFIVLSIIAVIATVACIIGRVCARRLCQPNPPPAGRTHAEHDMEHGFGMAVRMARPATHSGAKRGEAGPVVGDGQLRGGDATKIYQEARGIKGDTKLPGANFGKKPSK